MEGGPWFRDRAILVTGGTGTIGSEIVRQLLPHEPRVVRVFSRDETRQAQLRQEFGADPRCRFLIGDVRDAERLRCALEGVDVVFHAAALKHVPACEYNPFEAVQTNVVGTQNLIRGCRTTGVGRLVFISTDKAVNPVNTMGATKLLAENIVRAAQEWNPHLILSSVRFGNVLGSRGSLIPLLRAQIERGNSVELTSRAMTRFMMTIEEAVRLVLVSTRLCEGGELAILPMSALRIADLVEVFVEEHCRSRELDPVDIRIVERGIRPGEKLHEELITLPECQRLERRDGMYVVRPSSAREAAREISALPAEFCSRDAQHLDRPAIRDLLVRAGALRVPRAATTPGTPA